LECTFHNFLLFHFLKDDPGERTWFHSACRSPHPLVCERTAKVRVRHQTKALKSQNLLGIISKSLMNNENLV
jgi:hypothetical protein